MFSSDCTTKRKGCLNPWKATLVSPQSALPLNLIQSQMHCALISNDSHLLKGLLFLAFQMQDQPEPGKNTKGEDDRPHRAAFEDITNVSIPAFSRTCLKYICKHSCILSQTMLLLISFF